MQTFTYHRNAKALRSRAVMMLTMLSADLVTVVVLAIVLHSPWNWVAAGVGLGFLLFAIWMITWLFRTAHTLDREVLHLHEGRFRLDIPLDALAGAELCLEPLPRRLEVPARTYRYEDDTFYLAPDRHGLVVLRLNRALEVRAKDQGLVEFTRLVLAVDEPELLVAALGGVASGPASAGEAVRQSVAVVSESVGAGEAIRLCGLTRRYGDFEAVRGLNLAVRPGEVLAFLGSNGAGKTTTIKMMTGLLRPTAGQVWIEGRDLWAEGPEARQALGYVPDVPLLYESLTAREFLWLMAGLYGLEKPEGRQRAEELLAMLKLERWGDQQLRSFSLGMKRKMAIAAALVHRPRVLLLDEVTNGLDPRAAREVKDFIAGAAQQGAAVFLTTHLLDAAQELAHRVAIIERGELRALGTLDDLRSQAGLPGAGLEELFLKLTGDGSRREVGA